MQVAQMLQAGYVVRQGETGNHTYERTDISSAWEQALEERRGIDLCSCAPEGERG